MDSKAEARAQVHVEKAHQQALHLLCSKPPAAGGFLVS